MNIGSYLYDFFEILQGIFYKLSTFFSYTLGDAVSNLSITSGIITKLGLSDITFGSLLIGGGLLILIVYSIIK